MSEKAALIGRLMSHYWLADEHPAVRRAQLEDWLSDMVDFSPSIVSDACAEWRRRDDSRRPTPGQVRAICFRIRQEQSEHQMAIESRTRGWPKDLEEMWGPMPEGPLARQRALEESRRRKEEQNRRLGEIAQLRMVETEAVEG